jgi:hypothetical protein
MHDMHLVRPPAHDVWLNAEAKLMEFFRSSFYISTPVSQCVFIIRRSCRERPNEGSCIEASFYSSPCNELIWGAGSLLT